MGRRTSSWRGRGLRKSAGRSRLFERLEDRWLLVSDWQNPVDALDVNADRSVTPLDVLPIVNDLNSAGVRVLPLARPRSGGPFLDADGDGGVGPGDALRVVNALNAGVIGPRVLRDAGGASTGSITIGLGQDRGSRFYSFSLDATFAAGEDARGCDDRLEVYLVDPAHRQRTLLDGGTPGSPLLVLDGDSATYPPSIVRMSGSQVRLDLTSLESEGEGELQFRLLDNDGRTGTEVVIRALSNDVVAGVLVTDFPALPDLAPNLTMAAEWPVGTGGYEEIGFVKFDDASGAIDGVSPSDPGYSEAVRNSPGRQTLFTDQDGPGSKQEVTVASADLLGIYVFHANLAMAPAEDHLRVRTLAADAWQVGWEDSRTIWPGLIQVGDRGYDDAAIQIQASSAVAPLALTPIPDQQIDEQMPLAVQLEATGGTAQTGLSFSLVSGPSGAAVEASTGRFTWTPDEPQGPDVFPVSVAVRDAAGAEASQSFSITVHEVNRPPVLAAIGDRSVDEETTLSLTATATDPDLPANTLTFSLVNAPAGASINASTGLFQWTPTEAQGPGTYPLTVRVSDGALFDDESITITVREVNRPPVLAAIGDRSVDEETTLSFTASTADPDLPPNALTFSLDANTPAGAAIDSATGVFTWTPTETHGPGQYSVVVRVTDNGQPALSDTETVTITVREVNCPPILQPIPDQTTRAGEAVTVTASAADPDMPPNRLAFGLVPGAPDGATIDPVTGLFAWTPTDAQVGQTYPVTVEVVDDGTPPLSGQTRFSIGVERRCAFPDNLAGWTTDTAGGSAEGHGTVTAQACTALLREGDSFGVVVEKSFTIPAESSALRITFDNPQFDTTDPDSINDAFEIALVDEDGHSLVRNFAGTRDAFLNITEGLSASYGEGIQVADDTVTVGLKGLLAGTPAKIIFRLVSDDRDHATSVHITDFEIVPSDLAAAPLQPVTSALAGAPIDFQLLADVSNSLSAEYGRTSWNEGRDVLTADVTLRNAGQYPVDGPLLVGIANLSDPSVAVRGFDGVTDDQLPYFTITSLPDGKTLKPGEATGPRTLSFYDPERLPFSYDLVMLGHLNGPPSITSVPDTEALVGQPYRYEVQAADPDGDPLTFSLAAGPAGATLEPATGVLTWTPADCDGGTQAVEVRVQDGRGGSDSQAYVLAVRESVRNRPPVFTSSPAVDATVAAYFEVVDVPVGEQPAAVALGDFTGQGYVSLATANPGDQTVSVAVGQGDGTFDPRGDLSVGDPPPEVWREFYEPLGISVGFADPTRDGHDVGSIARGDFNHDGFLDLAAATCEDLNSGLRYYLVVLLGHGDGTFAAPVKISMPTGVSGLLARDFDRDGDLDLLAVLNASDQVYFLNGRGDGSFADPVAAGTTGDQPGYARSADFDADGILDLAVNSRNADRVAILPGRGDGTFGTATLLETGDDPMTFALADVDGSGSIDLVVGSYGDRRFEVRLNDGTGQFGSPIYTTFGPSGGSQVYGMYVADFDEDGKVDIAATSWGGYFAFLEGDGTGHFAIAETVTLEAGVALGGGPTDNDLPDFNGDGRPDLLLKPENGNYVTMAISGGDGSFDFHNWTGSAGPEIPGSWEASKKSDRRSATTVGDFNNDGVLDVVSGAPHYYADLSLLLGESATQFSSVEWLDGGVSAQPGPSGGLVAEDFNNDGQKDILYSGATVGSSAAFWVQLGQGDGSFGPPMAALPSVGGGGLRVTVRVADFDYDGNLDFVVLSCGYTQGDDTPRATVAMGHGDGTFSLHQVLSVQSPSSYAPWDVEIVDFNEDGFVDMAIRTATRTGYVPPYTHVEIWLNDPAQLGSFTQTLVLAPGQGGDLVTWTGGFAAADFNGDGHQDLVVHLPAYSTSLISRLVFYAGRGDGTFADPLVTNPDMLKTDDFVAGDFNADGLLDLAGRGIDRLYVLLGQGDGTFQAPVRYQVGSTVWDLIAEDLDGDGAVDLVAVYWYATIVFHGRGDGTFRWPVRYTSPGVLVSAADFDGDGALDLAAGETTGVFVYRSVKPGLQAVAVADINSDGQPDLLAANARNGHITPLLGNGDNTFTRQADILAGLGAVALATGDLNGDGKIDFVTANQFVDTLSVLVNDGTGEFARTDLAAREGPIAVAIGDVNGDGLADLVAANQGDGTLSLFVQQSDGSYARTDMPTGAAPAALALADLTGDGWLDVAVTSPDAQALFLYENAGDGTFAAPVRLPADLAPESVAVGDINGDGRPDLVVAYPEDGQVGIFYGQGGLRYTRPQMVSVGREPSALVLADVDADGRLDIVVSDAGSDMATVLLNHFDPARAYAYQPTAEDPDGDPVSFALLDGPGGMFLDPSTGEITWAPGSDQYGQHAVTIEVSDARGGAATQTYTIAVGLPQDNHAPIITSEPATTVTGTQSYSYQLRAVDPDGDPLYYELTGGSEQMTFDVLSRQVEWDARGTALAFDGQNRVDIPDAQSLHPRNLTLEGWFRLDSRASSQDLISKCAGVDSFRLWYVANSQLRVRVGNSSTTVQLNSGYNPTPGEWFHVAYTFDDDLDTQAIYINGVRRASGTVTISLGYDSNNILLGSGGTTDFFRGTMDEIRIWSVARTEAEIVADMRRALSGDEPGLLAYYPADDGQGKILHDRTSRGNDGYLGGPGSFAPRWVPSFGLQRAEPVTVQVRDVWGAVAEQAFTLTVSAETPATIQGTVYDDQNADGMRQPGTETALADRVVFIDANHNGLREPEEPAATTDAGGAYTFADLAAGSNTVSLLGQAGWRPTTPSDGAANLSVVAGQTLTADFGSTQQGVGTEDRGPAFTSTAPTQAQVDELYRYAAAVSNPDGRPVTFDFPVAPDGMAVDPVTGVVGWTPGLLQTGSHRVLLRVRDDRGLVAIQDFTVEVQPANTAPVIVSQAPSGPAGVGLLFQYRIRALDADQDPIVVVLTAAPAGVTLDPATGLLAWTPTADQVGTHTLTVAALDGRGGEGRQTFALEVQEAPVNHSPTIASRPRSSVRLGDSYRYEPIVVEPDGDPLTFTLNVAPAGMAVNSDGTVTWTAAPVGSHAVQLQVSDGRGGATVQDFTIEVRSQGDNQAPIITSRPSPRATVGSLYAYDLAATDADGDPLRWLFVSGPAGMALDELTGALRWTPRPDQLGPADVTVQVVDLFGGQSTQSFTLTVRGTNAPPTITTPPPTEAAVGQTYVYAVGVGAAEGDVLTFSLPTAPAGMTINAQTGVIGWTPEAGQVGAQTVKVQVANAWDGAASQTFTIVVRDGLPNRPPVVSSTPPLVATAGQAYEYTPIAADPEGQPLHFELRQNPVGMSIDPASGRVDWMPTGAQLGDHIVTIAALDPDGAAGLQSFILTVLPANAAPRITSSPVAAGTAGAVYRYDVAAVDDDHDPLWFTLTESPAGMTIDILGRITWATSAGDLGAHDVTVTVSDGRGGSAPQSFQVNLSSDTQAPRLSIFVSPGAAYPGKTVLAQVRAVDNVGVTGLELTVNGQVVPLSSGAIAAFTASDGSLGDWMNLVATARDAAGNVGTSTARVRVIPTEGWGIPEQSDLAITSPAADATITTLTDVMGTASVQNFREYRLLYRPADGDTFTLFASGTAAVSNGKLGTFDPTLLANDTYVLRLEVEDQYGGMTFIEQNVNVCGQLKLGNFQLSFTDLTIPVSGIPITVTRTYDSLQSDREGDCGYGWRLEYRNADLRVSVQPSGMEDFGLYTPFRDGTRVYVTLPGGRREGFTFTPEIHGLLGLIYFTPSFTPDPGVTSTLTVQKATLVNKEGEYYTLDGQPYNPVGIEFGGAYTLTTKDGTVYRVDAASGKLLTVTDRNSNRLTFSDSGVLSSTGTQVTFERDGRGRITAVVDPMGNKVRYAYDLAGDLVSVTDRTGNLTHFVYDSARDHYPSKIIDPLGRTGVRTEYDDQGRLVKAIDAAEHVVELTHDPGNSVETVFDQLGNPTAYEYDDRGNVVSETDALGGVTQRTYDGNNNMLSETDPLGHTTTYAYDSRGNVLSEVDPLGNTTRHTYNAQGQEFTVTDPLGNTVTNTYDAKGNLLSTRGASIGPLAYTYDASGRVLSSTDSAGTTTFQYDPSGNLIRQVAATGIATGYAYDANGRNLTQTVTVTTGSGPQTLVTRTEYDAEGRVTKTIAPTGSTTESQYDALGQEAASIDALGRVTRFRYDDRGQLIETIYPDDTPVDDSDNPRTRTLYDAAGRTVVWIDESGRRTESVYDALGRCVETIYPDETPSDLSDNPRVRTEFDAASRTVATVDERGNRSEYAYDDAGRRIEMVFPDDTPEDLTDNLRTRAEYDAAGHRIATIDALGHRTEYVYDSLGLLRKTRFADGTSVSDTYDARGRLVATTDQAGHTARYEHDANGQLIAVIDALGQRTEYAYDAFGNQVRQTDANGHVTQFEQDYLNRRRVTELPLGQRSTSVSDAVGNVTSTTDFNGDTIAFEYDVRNRLTAKRYPDGTSVTFTYTLAGLRASVTDVRGVTTYTYDARDRLLSRTDPDGRRISYTYDLAGNRTSVTIPSGTTSYTFDAQNRMATVTDPDDGVTTYAYDAAGNLVRTQLPNATVETRQYDQLNRLTFVASTGPGATINSFTYTLDSVGNRTRVVEDAGRQVDYVYDALGRLTEEKITDAAAGNRTIDYTYDPIGNRLTRSDSTEGLTQYSYDGNDRLLMETLASDVTSYTYDNNGDTLSKITNATDKVFYDWDFENRLVGTDTNGDGVDEVRNQYDDEGIRVSQTVNAETTQFLIDGSQQFAQVLEEYAPGGLIKVAYVWGRHLVSQNRDGQLSFYHTDALGSTRALTDTTGNLADRYVYDASGRTLSHIGDTLNVYLFAGEQWDGTVGQVYLRARYYDPRIGSFSSRDVFEGSRNQPLSLNRYIYANANPVNLTDATGHFSVAELVRGLGQWSDARVYPAAMAVAKRTDRSQANFWGNYITYSPWRYEITGNFSTEKPADGGKSEYEEYVDLVTRASGWIRLMPEGQSCNMAKQFVFPNNPEQKAKNWFWPVNPKSPLVVRQKMYGTRGHQWLSVSLASAPNVEVCVIDFIDAFVLGGQINTLHDIIYGYTHDEFMKKRKEKGWTGPAQVMWISTGAGATSN